MAPIDRSITPEECRDTRIAFADMIGIGPGQGVEGCPDAAKIFFVGRTTTHPDARLCTLYAGDPIDVDALLAAPLRHTWTPAHSVSIPIGTASPSRAREAAQWAIVAALGDPTEHDGRKHDLCGALGGMLRKLMWAPTECAAIIRAWLDNAGTEVDVEAGVRWACGAWDKQASDVSGRQALDAIVGSTLGATIQEAAMLPWRAGVEHDDLACGFDGAATHGYAYTTLDIVDIVAPPPKLHYVCTGLDLACGKVSAIQGYANTAKTPFALLLAICVAAGTEILGIGTEQCAVAYLDHEGGVLTQERLVRICTGLDVDRSTLPLTFARAEAFSAEMLGEIEHMIVSRSIGLLIIDTYSSALPANVTTFNDAQFRQWATDLARLGDRTGACVVIMLHENKAAKGGHGIRGISGHGSLAGAVQTAIALHRPDEDQPHVVALTCARAARKGFSPICIQWSDRDSDDALLAKRIELPTPVAITPRAKQDYENKEAKIMKAGRRIMSTVGPVVIPRGEIMDQAGGKSGASLEALARLKETKQIEMHGDGYSACSDADPELVTAALGRTGGFTR